MYALFININLLNKKIYRMHMTKKAQNIQNIICIIMFK